MAGWVLYVHTVYADRHAGATPRRHATVGALAPLFGYGRMACATIRLVARVARHLS